MCSSRAVTSAFFWVPRHSAVLGGVKEETARTALSQMVVAGHIWPFRWGNSKSRSSVATFQVLHSGSPLRSTLLDSHGLVCPFPVAALLPCALLLTFLPEPGLQGPHPGGVIILCQCAAFYELEWERASGVRSLTDLKFFSFFFF